MLNRTIVHLVDSDPETRDILVMAAREQGIGLICHPDCTAYLASKRREGLVLVHETDGGHVVQGLLRRCADLGHWPGVVGLSAVPQVDEVVAAMKAGAVSFHILPRNGAALEGILAECHADLESSYRTRVEGVRARADLAKLSRREREVLDGLAQGGSNKEIARTLAISPRTVEIHRMKMMGKIGATSAADAIRRHLFADMASRDRSCAH